MISRTIMMRLSSKGVPTKAKLSGKKSEIEGGSKPSTSLAAGASADRLAARAALLITRPPLDDGIPSGRDGVVRHSSRK